MWCPNFDNCQNENKRFEKIQRQKMEFKPTSNFDEKIENK